MGPEILTGGAFGPENSVVAVTLVLLMFAILLHQIRRRDLMMKPPWKRGPSGGTIPTRPASPSPPSAATANSAAQAIITHGCWGKTRGGGYMLDWLVVRLT